MKKEQANERNIPNIKRSRPFEEKFTEAYMTEKCQNMNIHAYQNQTESERNISTFVVRGGGNGNPFYIKQVLNRHLGERMAFDIFAMNEILINQEVENRHKENEIEQRTRNQQEGTRYTNEPINTFKSVKDDPLSDLWLIPKIEKYYDKVRKDWIYMRGEVSKNCTKSGMLRLYEESKLIK